MGSKLTGLLRKTGTLAINNVSTFLMESHDDEMSGEGNWTTNWVFTTAPRKVRAGTSVVASLLPTPCCRF